MVHFLLLLNIILVLSTQIHLVYGQSDDNPVPGRVLPGCALTDNKIYCFGGFAGSSTNNGVNYINKLNDHIELDLSAIGNFSSIDKSKIRWVNKSNNINGTPLGKVGQSATAVVSDGSYLAFGGRPSANNTYPFAVYHPQSDQWTSISLLNNSFTINTNIVNLGNDQIWIWGGEIPGIISSTENMLYIYDYKLNTWPTVQVFTGNVSHDHTATLVNNIVYIIGGFSSAGNNPIIEMSIFKTYNTIDGTWGSITTTGSKPFDRAYHTTVATNDNKYLIIYGGGRPLKSGFESVNDVYYVYNIEKQSLQGVDLLPAPGLTTSRRFGHYATIYNTNYLLLVFGYIDKDTQANENINVLNIQNVYEPTWSPFATITDDSTQIINSENKGVGANIIVPAVVVPVVVVLLAGAVALFFFIRHRKRKQKKQFILEQEDPRKLIDTEGNINNQYHQQQNNNDNADIFSEGTTVIRSNPSEGRNSLTIYNKQQSESSETHDHHNTIESSDITNVIKPSELIEKSKPSGL